MSGLYVTKLTIHSLIQVSSSTELYWIVENSQAYYVYFFTWVSKSNLKLQPLSVVFKKLTYDSLSKNRAILSVTQVYV